MAMPGNIGLPEVLVVLVIALIIFGPKRLPELGRSVGKGIREFRASISGGDDDDDEQPSKPAQIEGTQTPSEPVEGEVVTEHRS
jgi:sec-independent protein translocase protein TatA